MTARTANWDDAFNYLQQNHPEHTLAHAKFLKENEVILKACFDAALLERDDEFVEAPMAVEEETTWIEFSLPVRLEQECEKMIKEWLMAKGVTK